MKIKNCKVCGAEITKKDKICPECGTRLRQPWWKKVLIGLGIFIILIVVIDSCNEDEDATEPDVVESEVIESTPIPTDTKTDADIIEEEEEEAAEEEETNTSKSNELTSGYQAILNEYTIKLQNATPDLIDEYYAEAANNTAGLQGLATICNNKVSVLAGICNEGVSKMATYYYNHGSGSYDEYESWGTKLYDVYMIEAGKIQDAYMNSAM